MQSDYIIRATSEDGFVRAFVAYSKDTVEKARQIHDTSPVVTAALGRVLTAAAMMGCDLKNDSDLISVFIKGEGPAGGITVTTNSSSQVKGYPFYSDVELPLKADGKLDVSGAIGVGTLSIVKDTGMKEPYVGQIPLVSGEIAEDLTYYYAKSEQIPTAIALGVLVDTDRTVKQAGGLIIQLMPGADTALVDVLEDRLKHLRPITTLYDEDFSPEEILESLLGDMNINILDKIPMSFQCNCTREKVEKALISIGIEDLNDILSKEKKAELNCHFCKKQFVFDETDLQNLIRLL